MSGQFDLLLAMALFILVAVALRFRRPFWLAVFLVALSLIAIDGALQRYSFGFL